MPPKQPPPLPVTVELAPLPRQQVGPFLILGLDKDASKDAIEAAWAQRLIWCRRNVIKTGLEDVNWARDLLSDATRRLQADAAGLNVDTTDGTLRKLRQGPEVQSSCQPIDVEKDLTGFTPTTAIPALAELQQAITPPALPREVPAAALFLGQFLAHPVDPWEVFPEDD